MCVCVWPVFLFVGGSRQRLSGLTDVLWSDHASAFRLKHTGPQRVLRISQCAAVKSSLSKSGSSRSSLVGAWDASFDRFVSSVKVGPGGYTRFLTYSKSSFFFFLKSAFNQFRQGSPMSVYFKCLIACISTLFGAKMLHHFISSLYSAILFWSDPFE